MNTGAGPGSPLHEGYVPLRLAIVGAGRAGSALAVAAAAQGVVVTAVSSRDRGRAVALADRVGAVVCASPIAAVLAADLTLLAVPDDALTAVAAKLAAAGLGLRGRGVLHCSALRDREILAALRQSGAGVAAVHPLQALSGMESAPLLAGSLVAVDSDAALAPAVARLLAAWQCRAFTVPSEQRSLYHAAAVLAGNAPLVLLAAASDLLVALGIDRAMAHAGLANLLRGAIDNANRVADPVAALTGPVVRDDASTVAAHVEALGDHPELREIYLRLAQLTLEYLGAESHPRVAELLGAARNRQIWQQQFARGAAAQEEV